MKKAKTWLILLGISVGLAMAGAILFPHIPNMPVFPLLALIFGCFGVGYACSQLDELTGPMRIRVHIEISRHPKISITRV
jgi:hypothetical protein